MTVVYENEREKAKRALVEMLGQHGVASWPLPELVQELKVTMDDVFDLWGESVWDGSWSSRRSKWAGRQTQSLPCRMVHALRATLRKH